mmetsp:Transcript_27824/g.33764  ORF Transcript_27824/g.33764 Transcript_27824/m.33764 type:complete len:794 (-) Transcript_27824:364-2745(-)|eukprot:CAMPEP_0197851994 /NCGR_PEP_ID=MMETSP1438-20131217/19416_1 /TAXON_ID=1461541 /ORGANISM="Pterosperma sp., Strain CCMP1384" /LENGTH=793 /DNA_ID=CAMNT_0043465823 /DNA_START=198 /DNA_END=2579 /DNA_ORIENTATION=+
MGDRRKLQTEIERTLKKVQEGVELFDGIWNKVYESENANQKEKFEADLKKEIKKLQRYRDQIKTWTASTEIKDKKQLQDARKLIEREMERFKVCEKETKTKAFSKEGLGQQPKADPKEKARSEVRDWLNRTVEELTTQVDKFEAEMEGLTVKKGKQRPPRLTHLEESVFRHKEHVARLEQLLRLVDNEMVHPDEVADVKEFVDDYLDRNQDDFEEFSDVDALYSTLDLDLMKPEMSAKDRLNDGEGGGAKFKGDSETDDAADSASAREMNRPTSALNPAAVAAATAAAAAATAPRERGNSGGDGAKPDQHQVPGGPGPAVPIPGRMGAPGGGMPGMQPNMQAAMRPGQVGRMGPGMGEDHMRAGGAAQMAGKEGEDANGQPIRRPSPGMPNMMQHGQQANSQMGARPVVTGGMPFQPPMSGGAGQQQVGGPAGARPGQQSWMFGAGGPDSMYPNGQDGARGGMGHPEGHMPPEQKSRFLSRLQANVQHTPGALGNMVGGGGMGGLPMPGQQQQGIQHGGLQQQGGNMLGLNRQQPSDPSTKLQMDIGPIGGERGGSMGGMRMGEGGQRGVGGSRVGPTVQRETHDDYAEHTYDVGFNIANGLTDLTQLAAMDYNTNDRPEGRPAPLEDPLAPTEGSRGPIPDYGANLQALKAAYHCIPSTHDSEWSRPGAPPKHPVVTPASYPQQILPLIENPALFEGLNTDILFFAFYYQQGSYQQYLAARELKRLHWRYHKKYRTWFARQEQPKVATDEYEQGTYIYFDFHIMHDDFQAGWCSRSKTDFTFEYQYLEEELQ